MVRLLDVVGVLHIDCGAVILMRFLREYESDFIGRILALHLLLN